MIYLDNHATTPLDPSAFEAMVPFMLEHFANAGSVTHAAGREVAGMVEQAMSRLAAHIGAADDEVIVTSGATESNNLALFGSCLHPRQKRRKVVSVVTEHKAILDPLARLQKLGFDVELVPVRQQNAELPGLVDFERLTAAIDTQTAVVSVMLANNEIGLIQSLPDIAQRCRQVDCLLHSDASQAVGRMAVDVDKLDVDLMSFSAHKFYGPKGVGGLFVRRRGRRVKLQSQIVGGGQQSNFRSGTLNTAGIIGMQVALTTCLENLAADRTRILSLRSRLWQLLASALPFVTLNGPSLVEKSVLDGADSVVPSERRLAGNLNCCFYPIEGQSLMLETPELAVSSGSACTSAEPAPSHVLRAIGLTEEQARSSLRFGIGRFNTESDIDQAARWIVAAAGKLQGLI